MSKLRQADCVVILTAHSGFDYPLIAKEARLIIDTRNALKDFSGERQREFQHAWKLSQSIPDIAPGMVIEFAVEVVDRHPDHAKEPARSATRKLKVVKMTEFMAWIQVTTKRC